MACLLIMTTLILTREMLDQKACLRVANEGLSDSLQMAHCILPVRSVRYWPSASRDVTSVIFASISVSL